VVVSGGTPFEEDAWQRIRIGEVIFTVVKPCTRCTITTVDQETASRGKEPLRTLSSFRKRGSNVYFGENLVPENTGIIQTGDVVEVLEFDS
ncbi:MAG: MOSC domain-containing protein, partial [Rhodothermaceae bacterium]|nr:MOSC domain-containing protein [Rhodothermaceae bacterium]